MAFPCASVFEILGQGQRILKPLCKGKIGFIRVLRDAEGGGKAGNKRGEGIRVRLHGTEEISAYLLIGEALAFIRLRVRSERIILLGAVGLFLLLALAFLDGFDHRAHEVAHCNARRLL